MHNKKTLKITSAFLAFAMLLSCFYSLTTLFVVAETSDKVDVAVSNYVKSEKNNVTAEGLLNIVKEYWKDAEIDLQSGFYIKHAVNGVKDNTSDFPLDIKGSDGAVVAIIKNGSEKTEFVIPFEHSVETINITETAVVGSSSGFSYDANGNVIAYNGTADKIVFPSGYNGTMKQLNNTDTVQNVKVLIYNNATPFLTKSFMDWDGLTAVQMDNGAGQFMLAYDPQNTGTRQTDIFYSCDNLKYFQFPKSINNGQYWNAMYPNNFLADCKRLETLVMPESTPGCNYGNYGYHSFYGTAVREAVFVEGGTASISDSGAVFGNPSFSKGTRNIHFYNESMTYVRAVALAAARLSDIGFDVDKQTLLSQAKLAVKGCKNATEFADSLSYQYAYSEQDVYATKTVSISDGSDCCEINMIQSNTLSELSVEGYDIFPEYDPAIREYSLIVPNKVKDISVIALTSNNAVLEDISGTSNLVVGENTVEILVTTATKKQITYKIKVTRNEPVFVEYIAEAEKYVKKEKNNVTAEGLLESVQKSFPEVTLDAENDFYIKHAVNGVKDDTADYPLNIEGSDGAVAAVFGYKGKRYGFSSTFSHETEVISIRETAIVGKSKGFSYDANGNVIAYSGTADKMVFPDGYKGTMSQLKDISSVQNIKVLIYNNSVPLLSSAFSEWNGLIAVQMDCGNNSFMLASAVNSKREVNMFYACTALKYFQFPRICNNGQYWNTMFPNNFLADCSRLETLVLPTTFTDGAYSMFGYHSFYGTAVRDFVLPAGKDGIVDSNDAFGGAKVSSGTRNIHLNSDAMTFTRAAALAASKINTIPTSSNNEKIKNTAISAIVGSADAVSFADGLNYTFETEVTDPVTVKTLIIKNTSDTIPIKIIDSQTLSKLSVNKFEISPAFDPSVLNYSVEVPFKTENLDIVANAVDGAKVTNISGNNNLVVGINAINISVLSKSGIPFTYQIEVNRLEDDSIVYNAIKTATENYVVTKQNEATANGLLQAVKKVYPEITLDKKKDFYIKHSVNGVKDNTSDYPLNIEGSDGAVSAIFEFKGKRYGVTAAFAHEVEEINISETAIVGVSKGFQYDSGNNVIGYNGTADKIVFPSGYVGTMFPLDDVRNVKQIKVLIYNSNVSFVSSAFKNWDGLIAVQMDNGNEGFSLASAINEKRESAMFANCNNLKYFKFPKVVCNNFYWNSMFPNDFLSGCSKLETLILPESTVNGNYRTYGSRVFYGTSVRDFVLPNSSAEIEDANDAFGNSKVTVGTRNIHDYVDSMTLVRAAALAAAKVNELDMASDYSAVCSAAKSAVVGSANALIYADDLDFSLENEWNISSDLTEGSILMSDQDDAVSIRFRAGNSLRFLSVGYRLNPGFSPSVYDYRVTVPNSVSSLNIKAVPVNGAKVIEVIGNENFEVGQEKPVTIKVLDINSKPKTYRILVTRSEIVEIDSQLEKAIQSSVAMFDVNNYTTQDEFETKISALADELGVSLQVVGYYKYNSVPGATQGTEVLVPGHNGYITAVLSVSTGENDSFMTTKTVIAPDMKNFEFSKEQVSKKEDFQLSDDGKTLQWYSGNASKIVIPDGVTEIDMGWYNGGNEDDVRVIIVPDSVKQLPDNFCYGLQRLEACYLGNGISELPSGCFYRCYYLQFVHLPEKLEVIGYNAFRFAMALPELYIPTSVEKIGSYAFWICGVRNFNFPKNISVGTYGVAFPQANGGIWGEDDAQSPETVEELTQIMTGYHFNTTSVRVNIWGESVSIDGISSFSCSDYQATGSIIIVRAPSDIKDTVFCDKIHEKVTYEWGLDMPLEEAYARAQVALDHILIEKDGSADDVETAIQSSYYSKNNYDLSWIKKFNISQTAVSGELAIKDSFAKGTLVFNHPIFDAKSFEGELTLKGNRFTGKEGSFKNPFEIADSENSFENQKTNEIVSFDDYGDSEKAVNGDAVIEIKLTKLNDKDLNKKILNRLKGYAYSPFNLAIISEQDVELNGQLGVAVPLPKGFNGKLCNVYYMTKDGMFVDMNAIYSDGKLLFKTTVLGDYIVVQDETNYVPIIIVSVSAGFVAIAGAVVTLIILKKKKKKSL